MERLGKYEILKELGRGGMSVVYQAIDTTLGRLVALKVLAPHYRWDPVFVERFIREARVAARLDHPNILGIYEVGDVEGAIYIAMGFVEGGTLRDFLESRGAPLNSDEAVRIATQIASALQYAHSQGVVHRDVKPSNILLTKEYGALLFDFGIARAAEGTGITSTGTVMGTLEYMSPEQAKGLVVDYRSDIYSLGVVLYEMLTLKLPFTGKAPASVLYAVVYQSPIEPRKHNAAIPPNLERVMLRALAKEPNDRYQSAPEFSTALRSEAAEISVEDSWLSWETIIVAHLLREGRAEAASLRDIPRDLRVYALERFATEHPDVGLAYSKKRQCLTLRDGRRIRTIMDAWDGTASELATPAVVKSTTRLFGPAPANGRFVGGIEAVARGLADCVSVTLEGSARSAPQADHLVTGLILDTSAPFDGTKLPTFVPCIFLKRLELKESDLADLRSLLTEQMGPSHRVALLFVFGDDSAVRRTRSLLDQKMKQVHAYDFITLGRDDLVEILIAKDKQRSFRQLVLDHVDLNSVSPFVTTGPTPDTMFFGREKELRAIADHIGSASYTILAGRRIGKTSILGRLHRVRLPAAGFRTLYHDCSTTPRYEAFLNATILDWRPELPPGAPTTFGQLFRSPPIDKPLALLLDEADKLIPSDRANGWPLFNALRELINSGRAQVVLSGERTLREALQDPTSPLFNFANEMFLGPLDFRSVEELVTRPMKQLEIELVGEKAIVDRIWAFTSGHPNVVQRLCRRLIERLNQQGTRRVALADVDAVIEDPQFQEIDFLETFWEAATPLEKIITLVLSHEARTYRLKEVNRLLSEQADIQPSATATKDALDWLVDLRSILKRSQAGYEFAVEAFPLVLANTTTIEDLLEVLAEQYEGSAGQA